MDVKLKWLLTNMFITTKQQARMKELNAGTAAAVADPNADQAAGQVGSTHQSRRARTCAEALCLVPIRECYLQLRHKIKQVSDRMTQI